MNQRRGVLLGVLLGCAAEEPEVELVPATTVECPRSPGVVLLVDGRMDSFVCEVPAVAGAPLDVIAGQLYCSTFVPELLLSVTAHVVLTVDGRFLGICSLSAAAEGLTSTQAFDAEVGTCSLPAYGTDSFEPILITLTTEGVQLSGPVVGTMMCTAEEL